MCDRHWGYVRVCVLSRFSHVRLFAILWTFVHQALLSMGFSRQEHWSGLPCPPSGDLPHPGIEPVSPVSPALTGRFFITSHLGSPTGDTADSKSDQVPVLWREWFHGRQTIRKKKTNKRVPDSHLCSGDD